MNWNRRKKSVLNDGIFKSLSHIKWSGKNNNDDNNKANKYTRDREREWVNRRDKETQTKRHCFVFAAAAAGAGAAAVVIIRRFIQFNWMLLWMGSNFNYTFENGWLVWVRACACSCFRLLIVSFFPFSIFIIVIFTLVIAEFALIIT